MKIEVARASMDDFFPGVIAIGVGTDLKPPRGEAGLLDWRLSGAISNLVKQGIFGGAKDENMLFWSRRRKTKIYLFGTGASSKPTGSMVADCSENMARVLAAAREEQVVVLAEHLIGPEEDTERAIAFLSGFGGAGRHKSGIFRNMHILLPGDGCAKNYHEALRKAIIRKGEESEGIVLLYSENK